ncbi:hypothetical protein M407DRAFT_208438 [Tulasnella calospora MUT 4182]|uniref:Uncharacterized protein n=1 Tax=Tulasnella calospora MUT 4182 TaxID=1051891 RepID=A0A0C3QGS6_9AGAM|nr:hypothetical protein M407DRAFT_208438 [Tulasnella calospora MUT 4182]
MHRSILQEYVTIPKIFGQHMLPSKLGKSLFPILLRSLEFIFALQTLFVWSRSQMTGGGRNRNT